MHHSSGWGRFGIVALALLGGGRLLAATPATLVGLELGSEPVSISALQDGLLVYFDTERRLCEAPLDQFVQLRDIGVEKPGAGGSPIHRKRTPVDGPELTDAVNDDGSNDVPLREVMRRFPTGVTVVAACDAQGVPRGLTVNSFTSVSLDPPMVLVCISREAKSHDHLIRADGFAVSILVFQILRVCL